jgi:hypothetical protein
VTADGERTERKIMVTCDQWSYLTIIFRIFDVVWVCSMGSLCEGIRIDGVII